MDAGRWSDPGAGRSCVTMLLLLAGMLSGARITLVTLADETVSDTTASPTNASARYKLEADGDIVRTLANGGATDLGDWVIPRSAAGAAYECRATILSGSLSSGTAGSWLPLSADEEWGRAQTTNGTSQCVFTLEIRNTATLLVLATVTITLDAEQTVGG